MLGEFYSVYFGLVLVSHQNVNFGSCAVITKTSINHIVPLKNQMDFLWAYTSYVKNHWSRVIPGIFVFCCG